MRKSICVNIERLKELINTHSVEVTAFGHTPYIEKAIRAQSLFEEIHTCSDSTKEEFITYVNELSINKNSYERVPEIDCLFKNVRFFGRFQEVGCEKLEGQPHIFHRDIKNIIKL